MSAPVSLTIPWYGNYLVLLNPTQLIEGQVGYRWHGNIYGEYIVAWDYNWTVIADRGDEAVIAHTDQPGTPISVVEHGLGKWMPKPIAPDLSTYLYLLSKWIELCIGKYKGVNNMLDNDSMLLPQVREDIKDMLESALEKEYQDNFAWSIGLE